MSKELNQEALDLYPELALDLSAESLHLEEQIEDHKLEVAADE